MKFGQFSVTKAGSEGRFMHLRHLGTGQYLFETVDAGTEKERKEPVGIWLRSVESKEVQEAVLTRRRNAAAGKPGADDDLTVAKALVVKFQHVQHDDGHELQPTKEDIDWFFELGKSFINQCLTFASEPGNFIAGE